MAIRVINPEGPEMISASVRNVAGFDPDNFESLGNNELISAESDIRRRMRDTADPNERNRLNFLFEKIQQIGQKRGIDTKERIEYDKKRLDLLRAGQLIARPLGFGYPLQDKVKIENGGYTIENSTPSTEGSPTPMMDSDNLNKEMERISEELQRDRERGLSYKSKKIFR
jgi:hypothetical protein